MLEKPGHLKEEHCVVADGKKEKGSQGLQVIKALSAYGLREQVGVCVVEEYVFVGWHTSISD